MSVRSLQPSDVDAAVAFRIAMWNEHHPEARADAAMVDATRKYLEDGLRTPDRLRGFIAEEDGRAVGFALVVIQEHPPRITGRELRGYVTSVFVDANHRRRGHGRKLMDAIGAYAQRAGLRRLMLRTSTAGRALYTQAGYQFLEVLARDLPV
jgi:GNAT superfamily N-acetyltransferase